MAWAFGAVQHGPHGVHGSYAQSWGTQCKRDVGMVSLALAFRWRESKSDGSQGRRLHV